MLEYLKYAVHSGLRTEPELQPDARCLRDQMLELSVEACPQKGHITTSVKAALFILEHFWHFSFICTGGRWV